MKNDPGFRICDGKGFHMTFANGWTISVQFGPGNYSENYHGSFEDFYTKRKPLPPSATAEIAIFNPEGEWFDFGGDKVKGWVSPDDVLKFMSKIARKKVENKEPVDAPN
jgi:hypothetical protein